MRKYTKHIIFLTIFALLILGVFEVYVPYSLAQRPTLVYVAKKGFGDQGIADELAQKGIIKSSLFFKLYLIVSGQHTKLQAGSYAVSASMSIADIVKKFAAGDVIKNNVTIIEGWNLQDISKYFESKHLYSQEDFMISASHSAFTNFDFLKDKPATLSLEGYIFPDTYQLYSSETPEAFINNALANFNKKLTPDLKKSIVAQHRSIFQIVTMASILEKEVRSSDDKRIVSGILWKRIKNGMPLQVDSTVNYITGKSDAGVLLQDTKIDSPYNTYKYLGLPLGPICNPGMDSIMAAIYPKDSPYWFYLSADGTGKTIFSKTLEEQNIAAAKYLKS